MQINNQVTPISVIFIFILSLNVAVPFVSGIRNPEQDPRSRK
jgi:hypothetical protein